MAKKFYTKEKLVTARARSPRLRRLGVTTVNSSFTYSTSSGQLSTAEQPTAVMPKKQASAGLSVVKFVTSQGNPTPDVGQCYFDKILGLPLWWDGSSWVDSTGARLMSCVVDGVESSILEGASLVVEVPDGSMVTVMMDGEEITDDVHEDGIVTISYISGDIVIIYGEP